MGKRFKPLPQLEGAQAGAVDPRVHASVSASAGTGKTQVLTGRVLGLLGIYLALARALSLAVYAILDYLSA